MSFSHSRSLKGLTVTAIVSGSRQRKLIAAHDQAKDADLSAHRAIAVDGFQVCRHANSKLTLPQWQLPRCVIIRNTAAAPRSRRASAGESSAPGSMAASISTLPE